MRRLFVTSSTIVRWSLLLVEGNGLRGEVVGNVHQRPEEELVEVGPLE